MEYPFVEVTIKNDDLGFLPGGIHWFVNGRVLLRTTGTEPYPSVDVSSDLSDWSWLNPGWAGPAELVDTNAPGNPQRFYRLGH